MAAQQRREAQMKRRNDGGAVQVDGRSAPGRFGVEKRVRREGEAVPKGEKWGSNRI